MTSSARARIPSRPPPPLGVVRASRDPLAVVMDLGKSSRVIAGALGIAGALLVHGAAAARVQMIDLGLIHWVHDVRLTINDRLAATYDIDVEKPKPEEPPPEPPKPEEPKPQETKAEPPPAPKEVKETAPPPPPAAAQAAAALTAPDDDKPVDFTNSIAVGNGDTYAGGVTQAGGTSTTAVYDRRAQTGGTPGGTGTVAAPPKPAGPDQSRRAAAKSTNWACPFPPEAEAEQIDEMRVTVEVSLDAAGRVTNVRALEDPGFGFKRGAEQCARRQEFNPEIDRDGKAIATTRKFRVLFTLR